MCVDSTYFPILLLLKKVGHRSNIKLLKSNYVILWGLAGQGRHCGMGLHWFHLWWIEKPCSAYLGLCISLVVTHILQFALKWRELNHVSLYQQWQVFNWCDHLSLMRSPRLTRWSEVLKDLRISKRGCSHSKWHRILVEQMSVPPAEHIPQIVFGVDTSERIAVAQSNPASCCQQIRTSVTCCLEETVKATVILWWDTLGIYREPRSLHALGLVQDWVQQDDRSTTASLMEIIKSLRTSDHLTNHGLFIKLRESHQSKYQNFCDVLSQKNCQNDSDIVVRHIQ